MELISTYLLRFECAVQNFIGIVIRQRSQVCFDICIRGSREDCWADRAASRFEIPLLSLFREDDSKLIDKSRSSRLVVAKDLADIDEM